MLFFFIAINFCPPISQPCHWPFYHISCDQRCIFNLQMNAKRKRERKKGHRSSLACAFHRRWLNRIKKSPALSRAEVARPRHNGAASWFLSFLFFVLFFFSFAASLRRHETFVSPFPPSLSLNGKRPSRPSPRGRHYRGAMRDFITHARAYVPSARSGIAHCISRVMQMRDTRITTSSKDRGNLY